MKGSNEMNFYNPYYFPYQKTKNYQRNNDKFELKSNYGSNEDYLKATTKIFEDFPN